MGLMDEIRKLTHPYAEPEDDYDDYDDEPLEDEEPAPAPAPRRSAFGRQSTVTEPVRPAASTPSNRVVNISSSGQMQVVLVKPDRFDQVSEIADHLRDKQAVVLNLETTNKDIARRLVDFLSGCAYALDGKIKKIAVSTYLVTPYNVDVVNNMLEEQEAPQETYF